MYIAYFLNPPELRHEDLDAIEHAHKKFHDDWIDAGAVKFMVDGVVESHTAAMLEPYSDDPSLKGKLFWEPDKYKTAVAELDKHGFQLFTHAIGDYAVRTALDAYENAGTRNHKRDRRPRIEHIETIAASDIPRFGKLGSSPACSRSILTRIPTRWTSGRAIPVPIALLAPGPGKASLMEEAAWPSAAIGPSLRSIRGRGSRAQLRARRRR